MPFFLQKVKIVEFVNIFIIFFSGVLAHAFGIRLFGVWTRTLLYKITLVNCLALLRYTEKTSKEMLKAISPEQDEGIEIIFKYWQSMALSSLKNAIPDGTWQQISIEDWDQAMKILTAMKAKGAENEDE